MIRPTNVMQSAFSEVETTLVTYADYFRIYIVKSVSQ